MEARSADARVARACRVPPRQPAHAGAGGRRDWLRFAADDVLGDMLRGLGATRRRAVGAVRARGRRLRRGPPSPFAAKPKHAGVIHDFAMRRASAMIARSLSRRRARPRRSRWCACCSSRARRCRSAPTAIRRDSNGRSRPARCTMRRARSAGSATCSSSCIARGEAAVLWRAARRGAARRLDARSRAGTRGSARRARPRSCAPRREQMGDSLRTLLADLDCSMPRPRAVLPRARRR